MKDIFIAFAGSLVCWAFWEYTIWAIQTIFS